MKNKYMGYGKALDVNALSSYLCVGIETAQQIGRDAQAVIHIGRKKIYNRSKIDEYIDKITGTEIVREKTIKDLRRVIELADV